MVLKIFLGKIPVNLKYPPYVKINFWKKFTKMEYLTIIIKKSKL